MTVFQTLLIHDFTISRKLGVPDGQGGWIETWEPMAMVRGRLRPLNATERTVAAQEQSQITHVLYVEASANIARGDLAEGGGNMVEVLAIREPSHMEHHWEIDCREIQKEEREAWAAS